MEYRRGGDRDYKSTQLGLGQTPRKKKRNNSVSGFFSSFFFASFWLSEAVFRVIFLFPRRIPPWGVPQHPNNRLPEQNNRLPNPNNRLEEPNIRIPEPISQLPDPRGRPSESARKKKKNNSVLDFFFLFFTPARTLP